MNKRKNIVTIGGGSGQYVLLSGLRDIKNISITAIVSMVDSGGSTGRLRDEFGILPPGDVLKCLLALSPDREAARKILQTKFTGGSRLNGHNAGNMLLTMLGQYTGNFPAGINGLGQILNISGRVLPVTVDKATLVARLTDGQHLYGETTIDIPKGRQRKKIKKIFLVPHHSNLIKVYPPVIEAIRKADYIIIGPGDLYTSIMPNFLVPGVVENIKKAKAKLIYIVNIMTKFGETNGFTAYNFIKTIENIIKCKLNFVLINNGQLEKKLANKYQGQKAKFVEINKKIGLNKGKIIRENLISTKGGIVRHEPVKLAKIIEKIISLSALNKGAK